jgi:Cu/Ag efflux protein CusF
MKTVHLFAIAAALAAASTVHAQQAVDHAAHHAPSTTAAPAEPLSEGEVRKVDLAQRKVTLRHGPLVNLDMPGMTMVFTATDSKLLEGLKPGDKVKFTADKKDGAFVVTALKVVR